MGLSDIADSITQSAERFGGTVTGAFDSRIRLGVTGLSRAGKTVFITSLVANLLQRGRMPQFLPAARGVIRAAYLQPHPHDTVPRFPYEAHLQTMTGQEPGWPDGTRMISELRLSFRLQPSGIMGYLSGPRTLHLDIVDYPGEWLLDLGLLDQSYAEWSAAQLDRMGDYTPADPFLKAAQDIHAGDTIEEPAIQDIAAVYTELLHQRRKDGFSDCTPGRFLMPGDLEGAPALSFAPLPKPDRPARRGLWREMERRFEAYKRGVVRPFFQGHFSKLDRQIILVDVLDAIHRGPEQVADLRGAMGQVLRVFRHGQNGFFSQLWRGKRVDKLLFAATKADHLHHKQHPALTGIMSALLQEARNKADFAGADTRALSIAALRATVEAEIDHGGDSVPCVRGRLLNGKQAAFYAGELPENPAHLLDQLTAQNGKWLDADFDAMRFAPAPMSITPDQGPPHIRLDQAAEFLFADKMGGG